MPTTPHSAQDRRRQAAIPHSGCHRSPVRQLRSLLRHPGRCGSTVELATQDETCSAQFPSLFRQLLLTGLHLTTPMNPDPPPAWEGVRCRHVPLKEGRSALSAGGPDLPPRGGPGPPRDSRTPLVHALAPRPGGSGTATRPITAGARIYARP